MISQLDNGHFITVDENGFSIDEQDALEAYRGQVFQETDHQGNPYILDDDGSDELELIIEPTKINNWN